LIESEVPVFNQDEEFPTPKSVAEARVAVNEADAIWIFTPEYNHSVPGSLKNLFDWLSRPLEDGTPSVLTGKVMTMSGGGRSEHAAVRVRGVDALAHPVQNAHCAGAVHGRHTQPRDVQHR
jgi:NAD(P)H-dependent FMN reductase